MNPGEQRRLGFTYGLGRIAGIKDGTVRTMPAAARARCASSGSRPRLRHPFTVTSYIRTSEKGEKVTLLPPAGLRLAPGQSAEQVVPPPTKEGYSAVSWQVIADQAGDYDIKARVESIGTASVKVPVRGGIFD